MSTATAYWPMPPAMKDIFGSMLRRTFSCCWLYEFVVGAVNRDCYCWLKMNECCVDETKEALFCISMLALGFPWAKSRSCPRSSMPADSVSKSSNSHWFSDWSIPSPFISTTSLESSLFCSRSARSVYSSGITVIYLASYAILACSTS
jgi:hypothetical protein